MDNTKSGRPFPRVAQVGVVVRDMDAAIKVYQSLGIGPFKPVTRVAGVSERKMRGRQADAKMVTTRIMITSLGDIDLELVQPIAGESPAMEFLQARGEGVNHLGFFVADLEAESAKLEAKGARVIFTSKFANGGGARYFEIDGSGGLQFELTQWPTE